ncbi:unnamed protein product [Ilex paraguariensis]
MDYMDIDHIMDVPDTPDRLAAQNSSGRGYIKKESNSSVADHLENRNFFDGGVTDRLRDDSKVVIDNGSRRRPFCPPRSLNISDNSGNHCNATISTLGNSSSNNGLLFRRRVAEKTAKNETKDHVHFQQTERGKAVRTSHSSAYRDGGVVDLAEQNGHAKEFEKAFPGGALGNSQAAESNGSTSAHGFSSFHTLANSLMKSSKACKGKEKLHVREVGSNFDSGKGSGIVGDSQPKLGKNASASVHSIIITPPSVSRQKRLVRNGCISPHNIAKVNKLSGKQGSGPVDDGRSNTETVVSNVPRNPIDIRDIFAEDNNSQSAKGKGVMNQLSSLNEPDAKNKHSSSRYFIYGFFKINSFNN